MAILHLIILYYYHIEWQLCIRMLCSWFTLRSMRGKIVLQLFWWKALTCFLLLYNRIWNAMKCFKFLRREGTVLDFVSYSHCGCSSVSSDFYEDLQMIPFPCSFPFFSKVKILLVSLKKNYWILNFKVFGHPKERGPKRKKKRIR